MISVASLHVYPIKGLRGVDLGESRVDARGLRLDRRWMLVDESGEFLSQRSIPGMCLFRTGMQESHLTVSHRGETIEIPVAPSEQELTVRIWRDECVARPVSLEADRWFSERLGRQARLVYMPDETVRQTSLDFTQPGDRVGFADAFPVLVASQSSLDDLNGRLADPIPMNRFRPNIVLDGPSPFEEDTWSGFDLGGIPFRFVKKSGRCQVTTTNQETAEVGKEPLRTLATFRRDGNLVYFGSYFVPEKEGSLGVGQVLGVKY